MKYQEVVFENGIPDVNMVNEWVLQCGAKHGYYHISYSSELNALMLKYERGKYCAWCKLHPPVKLIEVIPVICPKDYLEIIDELDPIVEKYFNKYGAERVRGGRFSIVDEKLHMKKVGSIAH